LVDLQHDKIAGDYASKYSLLRKLVDLQPGTRHVKT
jgi:hypothetical protein